MYECGVSQSDRKIGPPENSVSLRLQLRGAIYRLDSLLYEFKAIRYESTSLNGIVGDKLHRVIVA